jgi:hypothetical protein
MTDFDPGRPRQRKLQELADIVRDLVLQEGDPAKVLELHYWSQEPGVLECIRAIAVMTIEARSALQAFLTASTGHTITVSLDGSGGLNLRPPGSADLATPAFDQPSRFQN